MRIGDGPCDLAEQQQARAQLELLRAAVTIDALPLDVFDGEKGLTLAGQARVVEMRDIRMAERGQDFTLACHAFGETGAFPGSVGKFQCNRSVVQAIGSLLEPPDAVFAD